MNGYPGVSAYRDRHGKVRWRYRRTGVSVSLKGRPGDLEFENGYKAARDGIKDRPRQPWLTAGLIYVIQGEPGTPVKIGFTRRGDAAGRLTEIQIGSTVNLRIIAQAPAYVQHERVVHRALSESRLRGEWFAWTPKVAAFVQALGTGIIAALDRTFAHELHGDPSHGEPLSNPPPSH